jgi:hypothetical protein
MSYQIVISRYNESLEWTQYMNSEHIVVYNKGPDHIPNAIPLKNVGREGNTFLHHIIEHYHDLPDFLILLQGDPFEHMNPAIKPYNLQENINYMIQYTTDIQPLFTIKYKEQIRFPGIKTKEYYSFFFGEHAPKNVIYAPGSQYIIPKANILSRPLSFYRKINQMLIHSPIVNYNIAHYRENPFDPNTIHGWCLERMFYYLFTGLPLNEMFFL